MHVLSGTACVHLQRDTNAGGVLLFAHLPSDTQLWHPTHLVRMETLPSGDQGNTEVWACFLCGLNCLVSTNLCKKAFGFSLRMLF